MKTTIEHFDEIYWPPVSEIYRAGLLTRNATFETEVPDFITWHKRFHHHLLWIAKAHTAVAGWAGLSPVSARKAYEGVAEVSVYVHPDYALKGIGKQLLSHLIVESEIEGIWSLYASIFPENRASIRLHEAAGFRKIGYRERIA